MKQDMGGMDHNSHLEKERGGKDKLAHSTHHDHNKAHGMHEGLSPKGGYKGGEAHGGGAGMEGNCDYD